MTFWWFPILCFINLNSAKEINNDKDPIVNLSVGSVRGTLNYTRFENNTYFAFRGIPYAEPPIGELRFERPKPAQPWEDILNATHDQSQCVQGFLTAEGSEDCLYLNVYTPKLPINDNTADLLPVMVYIHGGAFVGGDSSYEKYPPDYFLDQNVVFVSMNYRVGIFGFASTGDMVLPGNNGLKDQNLALRWVNEHIANFGGDNAKVTIFGQSAGSASVSYHLQSKLSEGLYNAAIMQSGSSLCLWALSRAPRQTLLSVATSLGVNTSSSEAMVDGLKQVDFIDLQVKSSAVAAQLLLTGNPKAGLVMGPVEEPEHKCAFFTGKSYERISKGDFTHVPTIIGYNSMEANAELSFPIRMFFLKYDFNLSAIPPIDMNLTNVFTEFAVGVMIKAHYFDLGSIASSNAYKSMQYISDDQFVRPTRQLALLFSNYVPTYLYRFTFEGSLGGLKTRTVPGAAHSEELGYLFDNNATDVPTEEAVRLKMVKLWTNFAKTGEPTPSHGKNQALIENVVWTPARPNPKDLPYLEISDKLEMKTNPDQENMKFWDSLYRVFGQPPYDTY